nr:uncharacterized protein LOC113827321 [Penaeus vannamei]
MEEPPSAAVGELSNRSRNTFHCLMELCAPLLAFTGLRVAARINKEGRPCSRHSAGELRRSATGHSQHEADIDVRGPPGGGGGGAEPGQRRALQEAQGIQEEGRLQAPPRHPPPCLRPSRPLRRIRRRLRRRLRPRLVNRETSGRLLLPESAAGAVERHRAGGASGMAKTSFKNHFTFLRVTALCLLYLFTFFIPVKPTK